MSDQIKIEELKLFLGAGLKIKPHCESDRECVLTGIQVSGDRVRIRYNAVSDCKGWSGLCVGEGIDGVIVMRGTEIQEVCPIVRPWSHLTREIEHGGERFVPIKKLKNFTFTYSNDHLCSFAARKLRERADKLELTLFEVKWLAEWGFDLFGWLNRTGPDGPLAVEAED